ncbi:MAG: flagellar biosynthesis protein FlhB [Planctomycetota bacterium]
MANDAGEKSETATPRRRMEARQKGQVTRSTDLSSAVMLLGAMLCLRWFGPGLMHSMLDSMKRYLTVEGPFAASRIDVVPILISVAMGVLSAAGPILVGVMILGALSNFMQVGFLFSTEPLELNLGKLNPISGFARLFSTRTIVQLVMNLLKLMLVCAVAYFTIKGRMGQVVLAMDVGGWQQVALLSTVLYEVGVKLALILLLIGLVDYSWQRWKHEQELKMTKEEVKEEMRRMEGDPLIKQRRRKMQFVALMQQIRKSVPQADVVVTNPTEFAVAIEYNEKEMGAPRVVAKGQDYIAQKIREIAIAHGVPIVERKPLAQALFKTVEVGQEVPEDLYKAIAEVLAYVYELTGKAPRRASA